ncbi:MAG TPA: molybdopterin cofactor-binding domain-containing protein [Burkholderiales bacterium]|nr:molybdopterin cofactor-binding domain-containing protein [Burkholderiales bacterium]
MRRRGFLLGALGVGGALVVGWGVLPPRSRLGAHDTLPPLYGAVSLNGWVRIAPDGSVVVAVPRSEMGQGVYTALPMLVAEEMGVTLAQLRVEQAPIDAIYGNVALLVTGLPFHPDQENGELARASEWIVAKLARELDLQVTGGSTSVRDAWRPMREAGAAARAMLIAAAAQRWHAAPAQCSVADGVVRHLDGRKLALRELIGTLREVPLPGALRLKPAQEFTLIGKPAPRLDVPDKVTGRAQFGIDVRLPGMLYAALRACPTIGGMLRYVDPAPALALPGVVRVSTLAGAAGGAPAVAVVADGWWRAQRALQALHIEWDAGPNAEMSSDWLLARLRGALDAEDGFTFYRRGDGEAALVRAARRVEAEYRAPYLAHAALEPINCTARLANGRLSIWAPTQVPSIVRHVAARTAGIDADRVDVNVTLLGGGFGRRLEVDFVPQAVWLARDVAPAPVQLLWSREEDTTHDFYRPAAIARMKGGLDANGAPLAWVSKSASDAIVPQYLRRAYPALAADTPDKTTIEGLFDQPYEFPHRHFAHVTHRSPVPIGFWRSVGHSHNAFFCECFIDEMAYAARRDPLDFRRRLLARHARHRAVLELAAAKAQWGRVGPGRAHGIALHECFGSIVAQVAEVSLAQGEIRVHRVVCALDCGTAVNPEIVAQQMESAIVFGLTAALYGEITINAGRVEQQSFPQYPMLTLAGTPRIDTHLVPSDAPPGGVGEVATPPIAPAVANALFRLTGRRLRSLPLRLAA